MSSTFKVEISLHFVQIYSPSAWDTVKKDFSPGLEYTFM